MWQAAIGRLYKKKTSQSENSTDLKAYQEQLFWVICKMRKPRSKELDIVHCNRPLLPLQSISQYINKNN